jgi:DNA end-binding protein Ku
VIGRRERIVMIEPWKKGLLTTLLRYGYEVRDDAAYFEDIPNLPINTEMRDLAEVII